MADVTLPQLGETVTEGTITQWFKAVGDTVAADEPLFEVSTDKVDTEVPSPVAGTLSEIRVPEGETVSVGTVIAVVGDASDSDAEAPGGVSARGGDSPQNDAADTTSESSETADDSSTASEAASQSPDASGDDASASGEDAPKDETPADGGASESGDATAAAEGSASDEADAARGQSAAEAEPAEEKGPSEAEAEPASDRARLLSPLVRRLVNEHGLDPESISGSGPGGRITRDDVQAVIDGSTSAPPAAAEAAEAPAVAAPPAPAPATPAPPAAPPAPAPRGPAPSAGEHDEAVKLTKIRKLTGAAMINSKAVSPHAFSVVEVDFHHVDLTRAEVKGDWKAAEGFSLTYLPFISRAVVDALDEFPHMNASVGDNELIVHGFVDLGIAVDLDYEGLIVPVVRGAEGKRLGAIAKEINDLAGRARTKKLLPDEISGGTFTISNNGSAGSVLTFPIINQPQVAILSTDAIVRKPVVATLPDGTEAVVIHPVGNLAMAWDHRAFDGAYAAGFLKRVKEIIETKHWSEEF